MKILVMIMKLLKSVWYNLTLRERQGGWSAAFGWLRLVAVVYGCFRNARVTSCFR